MRKLLSGSAAFMFLLVIMAGSASAALYQFPPSSHTVGAGANLFNSMPSVTGNIFETLKGPIFALLAVFGVIIALKIATQMMAPSEAELAFAEYEQEYKDYSEKMERKSAYKERYENEHWNDDF